MSTNTYSKGKKILDSENQELIRQVEKGEKSINKAFKEIREKEQTFDFQNENAPADPVDNNEGIYKRNQETLARIKQRYQDYLELFEKDITLLVAKDFIRGDEDVSGKFHSELQNCLEKFKSIKSLMENMEIDDLDGESIIIKNN